jgi:hypothetical protein
MKNVINTLKIARPYLLLIGMIVIVIILSSTDLIAQPPPMLGDPEQSPIDGGLSVVALAGGAYALKKLRQKK